MRFNRLQWLGLSLAAAGIALTAGYWLLREPRQTLPARHSEYHKVYDGWWDVACDTAMDGSDRRCYVQFVDVYSPRPDFRAAMVEIIHRPAADGSGEPVVTFDIEPDLSFDDAEISVSRTDGTSHPLEIGACSGPKCTISGAPAVALLAEWRKGESLDLQIREENGEARRLRWPLGNINAILDDYARQRQIRNLP